MKHYIKISVWVIVAILVLGVCVVGGICLKYYLQDKMHPVFKETTIFPDNKPNPDNIVLNVNDIDIRMVGIRSGKVCCKGIRDTIHLKDFYIAETEVTQELWMAIMGNNPSVNQECDSLPVENIDLVECLEFINKLDSISGFDFYVPSLSQWLYAAYLGKCESQLPDSCGTALDDFAWWEDNSMHSTHPVKQKVPNILGIYDMIGNVKEWTISGSDPLFVAGGSYYSDREHCRIDPKEIYHAHVKDSSTGLRLIYYPSSNKIVL